MQRLDPDGDGQINRGIAGPQVAADDDDDPFGGAQWQDTQEDALLGDQVPAAAVADDPVDDDATGPQGFDEPMAPVDDVASAPDPAPPAVDEPVVPVDVPDDVPDAPVDEAPDLPDEPPPPPEPVTHDDEDWLN
jgi:hypothetical protein